MKKIIIPGIFLLIMGYAFFIEPHLVKIAHVSVHSEKLPANKNLKIVHISDLHIKKLGNYEYKVISLVNAQQPDIIVITGDFIKNNDIFESPSSNEFRDNLAQVQSFLTALRAPQGIYVCRGNNDFGNDKEVSDLFLDALSLPGIHVLANSVEQVDADIAILGVDFPEFPAKMIADFRQVEIDGESCFMAPPAIKNSYTNFMGKGAGDWSNYTFSGKMMQQNPQQGGAGCLFYSQMYAGYDRFYRFRRRAALPLFLFSLHGAPEPTGDIYAETDVLPNTWYNFKVQVENAANTVYMRGKVWQADSAEPTYWQANGEDRSHSFWHGTVGLWSAGQGNNYFDDLLVINALGDTLLQENFNTPTRTNNPFGWVDFNYEYEAMPVLMQQVHPSQYTILLGHSPDFSRWAAAAQVDLLLSGHTHGGQLRLPLLGPIFVKTEVGRKFYQGLHQIDATTMYVTRGIGTAIVPARFLCPPEITIINLTGAKN